MQSICATVLLHSQNVFRPELIKSYNKRHATVGRVENVLVKKNELGHNLIVPSTVWGGFLVILNMQIREFAQISMNNGD